MGRSARAQAQARSLRGGGARDACEGMSTHSDLAGFGRPSQHTGLPSLKAVSRDRDKRLELLYPILRIRECSIAVHSGKFIYPFLRRPRRNFTFSTIALPDSSQG